MIYIVFWIPHISYIIWYLSFSVWLNLVWSSLGPSMLLPKQPGIFKPYVYSSLNRWIHLILTRTVLWSGCYYSLSLSLFFQISKLTQGKAKWLAQGHAAGSWKTKCSWDKAPLRNSLLSCLWLLEREVCTHVLWLVATANFQTSRQRSRTWNLFLPLCRIPFPRVWNELPSCQPQYGLILPNKIWGLLVSMSSDAEQRGDTGDTASTPPPAHSGCPGLRPEVTDKTGLMHGPFSPSLASLVYGVLGGREEAKRWGEALPLSYPGAWTCTAGCWGRQMQEASRKGSLISGVNRKL